MSGNWSPLGRRNGGPRRPRRPPKTGSRGCNNVIAVMALKLAGIVAGVGLVAYLWAVRPILLIGRWLDERGS